MDLLPWWHSRQPPPLIPEQVPFKQSAAELAPSAKNKLFRRRLQNGVLVHVRMHGVEFSQFLVHLPISRCYNVQLSLNVCFLDLAYD